MKIANIIFVQIYANFLKKTDNFERKFKRILQTFTIICANLCSFFKKTDNFEHNWQKIKQIFTKKKHPQCVLEP